MPPVSFLVNYFHIYEQRDWIHANQFGNTVRLALVISLQSSRLHKSRVPLLKLIVLFFIKSVRLFPKM